MSLTIYRITRDGADRLLFLLHGWSAEQHHLAAYVPLVDPAGRFSAVCPRAPHDLPEGDGASWYDREGTSPVPDSFHDALERVSELIAFETEAAGVPTDRCVVGGFSQGGFLALALATRIGAPRFAGVWAMCCGAPEVDNLELDASAAGGTSALVQVGKHDAIITPDRGHAAAAWLGESGWDVTLHDYDMGHDQRIEMMVHARDWLGTI